MKVLIVARHPSGGIRTYLRYIFQQKVMADLDVVLVTPHVEDERYFIDGFNVNSFRHIQCDPSFLQLSKIITKVILTWRPDILHSHGFTAGLAACMSARALRVPHVLTTHDVLISSQFRGLKGVIKKWSVGQLLKIPNILNPVGSDAKTNLIDTYPHLRRHSVISIRNGISSRQFLENLSRDVRTELEIDSNRIILGFFGRFMAQKGFSVLRDATAIMNRIESGPRFEVVCFGWGGFIREEQAELEEIGLSQWFHFLPGTNEMLNAIKGVDAVVIPSRWEACPLLPMEVLVSGTPVITSDCIGMREVTQNSPALIFPVDDVEALCQKLSLFAANQEKFSKKSADFREIAACEFDVSRTAEQVMKMYMQLLIHKS